MDKSFNPYLYFIALPELADAVMKDYFAILTEQFDPSDALGIPTLKLFRLCDDVWTLGIRACVTSLPPTLLRVVVLSQLFHSPLSLSSRGSLVLHFLP